MLEITEDKMNQEKELHPGKSQFVSNALYFIGKYLYKPRFKIVYELTEELKTLEGPVLVLSKHSSNHDIPIGYRVLVDAFGRHAWCIIKKSLTHPLFFDFFQKWELPNLRSIKRSQKVQSRLRILLFA